MVTVFFLFSLRYKFPDPEFFSSVDAVSISCSPAFCHVCRGPFIEQTLHFLVDLLKRFIIIQFRRYSRGFSALGWEDLASVRGESNAIRHWCRLGRNEPASRRD